MRVLLPVEHLGPNDGVAVQTFQVAQALVERGHEVDVCYRDGGIWEDEYRSFATTVEQVRAIDSSIRRPWSVIQAAAAGLRVGRRTKPDVVYDNLGWTLPATHVAAMAARAPVVSHLHGFGPDEEIPRFLQPLLARSDHLIAVSHWVREHLRDHHVDRPDVTVIHNGIDPSAYPVGGLAERASAREELGLDPDAFVVLCYGRVHPTKGVEVLLEALKALPRRDEVELLVVGHNVDPDYLRQLRQRAEGLRAHWRPAQTDVVRLLHAADVAVAPFLWQEPFGRVVVETLASGRPVIASAVGGVPEILTDGLDDLLVPPGEAAPLTTALDRLRTWRQDDPGLATRCRSHVEANFTLDRMVDGIEAVLLDAQKG